MKEKKLETFNEDEQDVLNSVRTSRIIFPILIGLGVVFYLLSQQFDPDEFAKIEWKQHTQFWVLMSFFLLVIRHIAYAIRLRILTEGEFTWKK